jgi:glycosyltransferase involved in cell wall biosynthesis
LLSVRICIVYDCLYPHTVGGAERWYGNLAKRFAEHGHEVTYLTMRQWDADDEPELLDVRVKSVAPQMSLYADSRRRILPPLTFGFGVFRHLLRHGQDYDVVHTASFPFFSLLAAALVRPRARYRLVVDWHELWTRRYWHDYLGPLRGQVGWRVQQLCLRVPQRAFCFSRLVERRLRAEGVHGEVTLLEGQFGGRAAAEVLPAQPVVVFAGRHLPEKNPVAVVQAVAKARESIPELRAEIYGDGPEHSKVLAAIAQHGLENVVEAPGFVDGTTIDDAIARALCLLLPSRREGYGLVVLEALSKGTPAIVVRGDDNAATEFITEGENGYVASHATPEAMAEAIAFVHRSGIELRESTLRWFTINAARLALATSLDLLEDAYARA